MIPRKAKQAVLSLVTTEQSKYGGTVRSTQSTLSAGDWGEPSLSVASAHGPQQPQIITPHSTDATQDPWMMVTGSGSSYLSNNPDSAGLSSGWPNNVAAPLATREQQLSKLPPLQLLDRYDDTDPVLDVDIAQQIRLELPRKLRNAAKWNLVYSSDQHGISMTTLFYRCRGKGPMVLAIKDVRGGVFGAYVSEALSPHLSYYGTGECFLWDATTLISSPQSAPSPLFVPSPLPSPSPLQLSSQTATPKVGRSPSPSPLTPSSPPSQGRDSSTDRRHDLYVAMNDSLTVSGRSPLSSPSLIPSRSGTSNPTSPSLQSAGLSSPVTGPTTGTTGGGTVGRRKKKPKVVQFWKWTGKNDYMVLSEPGFIGFGGGDGKFGLWIHSDLETGHSSRCATFDNEPLAAACHKPIHLHELNQKQQPTQMQTATSPGAPVILEAAPRSRSSSPKHDREEFYCQTIEIWALAL
ncbi:oxidation resistance protein 1 [Dissophora globulifera]|uniref:Oxidation resistance protein 1 n=1 Tax=Dissophora globulifera TaxID=979702 RepID=A0A9P6RBA6_9FUNG|nr:oxidation resistance protein 1 [Dissophora globulifera]